jgi:hypothetical protein
MRSSVDTPASCSPSRSDASLSSVYGFLAGTWPFGVVEAIWAAVALHRYQDHRARSRPRK